MGYDSTFQLYLSIRKAIPDVMCVELADGTDMVKLSPHLSRDSEDALEICGGSYIQLVFQSILISTK